MSREDVCNVEPVEQGDLWDTLIAIGLSEPVDLDERFTLTTGGAS